MMNPNEYDAMVEHLAAEIIEDCFEKTAAPRKGRIEALEEVYSQPAQSKLLDAMITRDNSRLRRAGLRSDLKDAKKAGDKEKAEEIRKEIGSEKRKRNAAIRTQLNPMNSVRAVAEYNAKMPFKYKIGTYGQAFDANVAKNRVIAKRYADQMAEKAAFEDFGLVEKTAAPHEYSNIKKTKKPSRFTHTFGPAGYQKVDGKRMPMHVLKETGKVIAEHPYIAGSAALASAAAGAGVAAYKHNKKKKEEQKEKVAAYYEDALEKSAAAENVWAFADQFEDSYESLLMKQAAEELFEEAQAQAEAAENVYDAIENGDVVEDDYIDADFEGVEE